jgi:hypothetical protein
MMEAKRKGRLRNWGLTELFFETDEPPFDKFPFSKFKKRFPEGKYTFTGRTVGGARWSAPTNSPTWCPTDPW